MNRKCSSKYSRSHLYSRGVYLKDCGVWFASRITVGQASAGCIRRTVLFPVPTNFLSKFPSDVLLTVIWYRNLIDRVANRVERGLSSWLMNSLRLRSDEGQHDSNHAAYQVDGGTAVIAADKVSSVPACHTLKLSVWSRRQ